MRVVGIAGGPRKTAFVRDELGADAAVDYQASDFEQALAKACPHGVDVFFDTVGGPTADCVSRLLAKHSQYLLVGRVFANNSLTPEQDMANLRHIWSQETTVHAFSRYSYKERYPIVIERLGALLRAGKLTMHNVVVDGMESTPTVLNQVLSGQHVGKALVRYADAQGARI
jgi:NADPH-dependent curcumin reductase CurA